MRLTRLNITKCIITGDVRRVQDNKPPVRNISGLSKSLEEMDEEAYDADKIYFVLYRADRKGLEKVDDKLLKDIMNVLMATEDELVRWPRS